MLSKNYLPRAEERQNFPTVPVTPTAANSWSCFNRHCREPPQKGQEGNGAKEVKREKEDSLQTELSSTWLLFERTTTAVIPETALTSWQYWRIPSFVPMQVLVPEGSDSHFPFCTFICMLSLPQNMAIWGSASSPAFPSAGTWKEKKSFNLTFDISVQPKQQQVKQVWDKLQTHPINTAKTNIFDSGRYEKCKWGVHRNPDYNSIILKL